MEYLDGENLSRRDRSRTDAAPSRRCRIATELCRFVEDAHRFEPRRRRSAASIAAARRSEAAQHPADLGGPGEGARLRHRQGAVPEPEGHAQRFRQRRVSVARASRDGRRRSARRLLGASACSSTRCSRASRHFARADTRRLEKQIIARGRPPLLAALEPPPLRADRRQAARAVSGRSLRQRARDPRGPRARLGAGEATRARAGGLAEGGGDEPPTRRTQPAASRTRDATYDEGGHPAAAASGRGATSPPIRGVRRCRHGGSCCSGEAAVRPRREQLLVRRRSLR